MAKPITSDVELLTAIAQIVHDGQNGNLDKDKCHQAQTYLLAQPNHTVTGAITAVSGNH